MIEQRIIHGDAMAFPPSSEVDHVFCDPPFSPHVHAKATTSADRAYGTKHNDFGFAHLSPELRSHIVAHVKAARKWSLIHCDVEGVHGWREELRDHYIRSLPWVRWGTPQKSGDRPVQGFEIVIVAWGSQGGTKRPHWHGPGNLVELEHECDLEELDALRHKAMRGKHKHKCQKPLDQALDLVDWFSDPGDLIVDLCAGRGTYGVASRVTGRSFIGFECDEVEARKAQERLARFDGAIPDDERERVERWLAARRVTDRPPPKKRA